MRIVDGRIIAADIVPGAVGSTQLAAGAVGSTQLAAGAVGTSQLTSGSVTEPMLEVATANAKNAKRTARFVWDFATDGGSSLSGIGVVLMRGEAIPARVIMTDGRIFVETTISGATGAVLGITNVSGDVLVPVDTDITGAPWNTAGAGITQIASGDIVTISGNAAQKLQLVVSSANLLGGSIKAWVDYVPYSP